MPHSVSRLSFLFGLMLSSNPAFAESDGTAKPATTSAWEASRIHDDNATISTGVAKARDPLNSATSTSVIKEPDIRRLGPTSIGEILRTVPGIRVETDMSEGGNSYSIRGLPLVSEGAKYVQLQEDGLPTLQFGDVALFMADPFLRNDINLGSVESIRGGSSSTFASDAPGGVINFISKTGEVEGGSVILSAGLERGTKRMDADFGGRLGNDWRFHIGGFYRVGEGPRTVGYDAYRGGQIKMNVTREFAGGYVRFSLKVLDDQTLPPYSNVPLAVTGTGTDPHYASLPGFDAKNDLPNSRNIARSQNLDPNGRVVTNNILDGQHTKSVAVGMQAQFNLGGWTISNRFRYAKNSAHLAGDFSVVALPVQTFAQAFGGAGTTAVYFNGPNAGQPVSTTANGNGVLLLSGGATGNFHDLDFAVNDLRASRVYQAGQSEITVTSGLYAAHQTLGIDKSYSMLIQDAAGDGKSALVNLVRGTTAISQEGQLLFSTPGSPGNLSSRDVGYTILAPYASLNVRKGDVSIGGSIRYDTTAVRGISKQDGVGNKKFFDLDGNGVASSVAESTFAFIPQNTPSQVNYNTHKISWSTGVNWRIAESFSAFARYSSGGRNGGDRILKPSFVNGATGELFDESVARDSVRQAEAGIKFRRPGVTFNVTGFYATTKETNSQIITTPTGVNVILLSQGYRAYGAEVEAAVRHGPLSLNAGATLTHAEITEASGRSDLIGNTPRHQPRLLWQLAPQYETDLFTVGASIVGTTGSFSQDVNKLRMPGYATVGAFLRVRPIERLELGVNVSNLFDKFAIVTVADSALPTSGVALGTTLAGRRAVASARIFF